MSGPHLPVGHVPVMLAEVLRMLQPKDGEHYVDGTFGGGGYARALPVLRDGREPARRLALLLHRRRAHARRVGQHAAAAPLVAKNCAFRERVPPALRGSRFGRREGGPRACRVRDSRRPYLDTVGVATARGRPAADPLASLTSGR